MTIKVTKLSDQGTTNPIVARMTVQSSDILDAFPIKTDVKEKIFSVHLNLCTRLLEMKKFETWLQHEYDEIKSNFLLHGLEKVGADAFETPQIIGLETRVETFLQSSKLSIRDCGSFFGMIFGERFGHRFDKIIKWAKRQFGENDDFFKWIEGNGLWIKQVIDMRNALEHPTDEPRGCLFIQNVDFTFSGGKASGSDPVWFLTGDPPSSLVADTQMLNKNLLNFAEDLLAISLLKKYPEVPLDIQEIPLEERDLKCPVRLQLVPRGYLLSA